MVRVRPAPEEIELPETCRITPSKINPWRGAKAKGARFTRDQLYVMEKAGIDPADPELPVVAVRSMAGYREQWVPVGTPQPVYVMPCPILEERANGFRLVISPSGERKLVHESGRLKRGQ